MPVLDCGPLRTIYFDQIVPSDSPRLPEWYGVNRPEYGEGLLGPFARFFPELTKFNITCLINVKRLFEFLDRENIFGHIFMPPDGNHRLAMINKKELEFNYKHPGVNARILNCTRDNDLALQDIGLPGFSLLADKLEEVQAADITNYNIYIVKADALLTQKVLHTGQTL